MNQEQLHTLLTRYNNGTASEEEKVLLESWYLDLSLKSENTIGEERLLDNLQVIANGLPFAHRSTSKSLRPILLKVASVLLIVGAGFYFYPNNPTRLEVAGLSDTSTFSKNPLEATITLANGQQVRMSQVENGEIVQEGDVSIRKDAAGEVSYDSNRSDVQAQGVNTLTTPKGGTYSIKLADGTKVTLNAASVLKYPTTFIGERRVELSGEAYFEVSHDPNNRFIVVSKEQEVVVMGTRFNINSYANEKSRKTTLLDGMVALKTQYDGTKEREQVLRPGDQVEAFDTGALIKRQVNTDDAIAWTRGKIVFDDETIASVMRKICLWYDVEVVYEEEAVQKRKIAGTLSRVDDIKVILAKIEFTGAAKFKIQGRRIIVMS